MFRTIFLFALFITLGSSSDKRRMTNPNLKDCMTRTKHANFNGHNYFFSWESPDTKSLNLDWWTSKNICRRHCMDLVSLETDAEYEFLKKRMLSRGVPFTWTSGRKCNFDDCRNRRDLQPPIVRGWYWSGSGTKLATDPSGTRVAGPWSKTGGDGRPQPDNREFRVTGKNDEACLAMLNNFYGDGIVWHDIACYHKKPFVCEDSPKLIELMKLSNPGIII